ncbi:hypothetical protein APT_01230 [Acetobacter pasteurianus NBRC 101655]|nr:hypothetical protein ApDm4_0561 [Acetobacter pomorum]BAU38312.1 hypothetical protein APT_01230 [Acetobacter pasteurianus NBRC 101655]CCT58212.1 hypothetical protein APA386B_90 [Acetobacter pasteurianus 386B]
MAAFHNFSIQMDRHMVWTKRPKRNKWCLYIRALLTTENASQKCA